MTTRTGEPATKRESYTTYLQGRAAQVRLQLAHPPSFGTCLTASNISRKN